MILVRILTKKTKMKKNFASREVTEKTFRQLFSDLVKLARSLLLLFDLFKRLKYFI